MIQKLISGLVIVWVWLIPLHGQSDHWGIAYLNAQTVSLTHLQAKISGAYLSSQGEVVSGIPHLIGNTSESRHQELYKKIMLSLAEEESPKLTECRDLLQKSRDLHEKIYHLAHRAPANAQTFKKATVYFEDIYILNQKIFHTLTDKAILHTPGLEDVASLYEKALSISQKLIGAYRYGLVSDIGRHSQQLESLSFPRSDKHAQKFSDDFRRLFLQKIEAKAPYNEKILPVFNLWVEVYNTWLLQKHPQRTPMMKLGPKFIYEDLGAKKSPSPKEAQNLIFLLDISGSMGKKEKLPLLKRSLIQILLHLHADDKISIVGFTGSAQQLISNCPPKDAPKIETALSSLQAKGNTDPYGSFEIAYQIARAQKNSPRKTRIILLTDGAFEIARDRLPRLIEENRFHRVSLSILYCGIMEDSVRHRLQKLAEIGKGHYLALGEKQAAENILRIIRKTEALP